RATSDTAADVNLSFRTGGITNSEERMRIASSGNVGIGTSNPGSLFSVLSPNSNTAETIAEFGNQTIAGGLQIETNGNLDWGFNARNSRNLTFSTNQDEAARIDSSGRLLVGTSSVIATPATLGFAGLQVAGTGTSAGATNSRFSNNTKAPFYEFAKSRGTTLGTQAVVGENDQLGTILFSGSDGSAFVEGARIRAQADGTPGANDMPGRLVFSCTIDGASSPTEHFRIANDGTLTATDTTIGSNSDSRLKTNVADFVYSLEDFKQYQPKTFDWKNPGLHGNQTGQRGFIAQDVENIDGYWVGEQAVEEDSEDAKFLNEDLLAKTLKLGKKDAMYVSVIQQLLAKIETLEQRLTDAGI
ncbi:MAG: tail fiber domain-containing protein, partial [Rhodospirillales bacterium]